MLLSQSAPTKIFALGAALLASSMTFYATAGQAKTDAIAYSVELEQPAADDKFIVRGTAFVCEGTTCKAAKSSSAAIHVCSRLVREAGPVASFSYKGEAFDADRLARCNN